MSNSDYWINKEENIVLIWSPKCACTSLHNGFIRDISKISEITDSDDPREIAHKKKYWESNYNKIPKNFFIYWGIRNPFDRIVSCFINKFLGYNGKRLNGKNLEFFAEDLLTQIEVNYIDLTFNKFLYGIQDLISKNIEINRHFNTQTNINNYNKIKSYSKLILFDINNIPLLFGSYNINSTNYSQNSNSDDLCDVKATEIDINNVQKKNFINSKELIKKIYSQDYQIFKKHNIFYL